jgi:hypothetical protein
MEVARVYSAHLSHVTLRQSYSAPGQFGTPAAPLAPPAYRTGALAASVFPWPGPSSGFTGNAYAGPHVIYGRTQERGAIHEARNFRFMHWENDGGQLWHLGADSRRGHPTFEYSIHPGGEWWKKRVYIPPRPYVEPGLYEVIADGSLVRSAALMWRSLVGYY